jgi:hypothetical protein
LKGTVKCGAIVLLDYSNYPMKEEIHILRKECAKIPFVASRCGWMYLGFGGKL